MGAGASELAENWTGGLFSRPAAPQRNRAAAVSCGAKL